MTDLEAQPPKTPRRHRVVIIGSGFGGLEAAKRLKRADVDITLISKTTSHLFQPLLYQVATGILSEGEIAPTTRLVLRKQKNVQVLLGEIEAIDLHGQDGDLEVDDDGNGHRVRQPDRRRRSAAVLLRQRPVLDVRAGNEDHRRRARTPRPHPRRVRSRRGLHRPRRAGTPADVRRRRGGPTGVELAGQIAELAERTLAGAFRTIKPNECRVILRRGRRRADAADGPEARCTGAAPAGEDGRRDPAQLAGDRRRLHGRHREAQGRHASSGSNARARCGRQACRRARWAR